MTEYFDYALAATGRAPNVEHLDLQRTGMPLKEDGVPVFDRRSMQCGEMPIFLAGDVDGDVPFLHEASDEGRIAGGNAARFLDVRSFRRRAPLAVVFSDPQIAVCGARYAQLKDQAIAIGSASFANQGRARVMRQNHGLVRVYAQRGTGQLLGAEMVAPAGEHLGHLLSWAIQQGLTVTEVLDMPFYHPVVEEGLRSALRDAAKQF
jgi:dihydrolipoamide dehydrogenase